MGAWLLLFAAVLSGFAMVRALWPGPRAWSFDDWLRASLAPAAGIGLAGILFFVVRIQAGLPAAAAVAGVPVLGLACAGIAWWRARRAVADAPAPGNLHAPMWLWMLFGAGVVLSLATYLMLSVAAPHGEWDAWSIWNLRARFLFRAENLSSAFSPLIPWAHPDYPLLLPAAAVLFWTAGGAESMGVIAAMEGLLLLSAVAAPSLLLSRWRGTSMALVAALGILAASSLVRIGSALYADVPLAAYIVCAAVSLVLATSEGEPKSGPLLLAGLMASFAAATKNEGLLFCLSLGVAFLITVQRPSELKTRLAGFPYLIAGAAPALLAVLYFKMYRVPPNDLVHGSALSDITGRLLEPGRHWATFWAFVGESLTFGNVLVPPIVLFGVWLALLRLRAPLPAAWLLPLAAAALQLVGYFLVFVGTSPSLDWHLNTALGRLLLHVWPLFVLGVFLISGDLQKVTATPQQRAQKSR